MCGWKLSDTSFLPTLQLHVWLEIMWYYFQFASAFFMFDLQQVVLAIVYM